MHGSARMVAWVLALALLVPAAHAGDIKGAKDHPEIGRFAGSTIIGYNHRNFDEYLLPESPIVKKGDNYIYEKSRMIEGDVTRILYVAPKEASVAEVYRNYEKQLKRKGFETLFSCRAGEGEYRCMYNAGYMKNFKPPLAEYAYYIGDHRYLSMKKSDPRGDLYVSLLVYDYTFSFYNYRYRHPMVQLDVIRSEPLDDSQIKVLGAADLSNAIRESGHVALHGIYFDTDSAKLRPESDAALAEIGKLMKHDAALKLYVVGHTDNAGSFSHNMQLSEKRAASVAAALTARHGIAAERLSTHGVGQLAPVASNDTEEGRARNRRVELVRK